MTTPSASLLHIFSLAPPLFAPNRDIGRVEAGIRFDKDYFCRATTAQETAQFPTFTEVEFERRFRIPRAVYEELRESVFEEDPEFFE
jgi:hypothetical protein